jgi:hypothetical protein
VWPFAEISRGAGFPSIPPQLQDVAAFAVNTIEISIRPTQRVLNGLDWLAAAYGVPRNDIVRAVLFKNVYGSLMLEILRARVEMERRAAESRAAAANNSMDTGALEVEGLEIEELRIEVWQSPRRATQVDLHFVGKAVSNAITLKIPLRLSIDLTTVADAQMLGLPAYCRKALVQEIEGESVHTPWSNAVDLVNGF